LLEELRVRKIENFIFSSSCTVYGQADKLPITEKAPVKPAESPYGYSKQVGEIIIRDTCKAYGLNAIALRYFNPIGAHASIKIGELPIGVPQNLIPFITQTAAGIREELSVYGDDYPTSDGTAVRDYIHVVDLAKAHIAALNRLIEKRNKEKYEYFNVGTGTGSSVLEVIKAFEKASGSPLKYKIVGRREGDITSAYADTSIANKELNWKTELTLDEALDSAWKWQKSQN
jgi:UDP-glucose 4-epimerase